MIRLEMLRLKAVDCRYRGQGGPLHRASAAAGNCAQYHARAALAMPVRGTSDAL